MRHKEINYFFSLLELITFFINIELLNIYAYVKSSNILDDFRV